jgi:hypothetical protein
MSLIGWVHASVLAVRAVNNLVIDREEYLRQVKAKKDKWNNMSESEKRQENQKNMIRFTGGI